MNRLLIKLLKFIVRSLARYHRFIDPVDLLAKLARFGQPSEVAVPTELLRAGAKMHARGLLNSQAIQYNLDWVWPYWVDRQFDPADTSFVPRAFSLTHINLTHRNWTCVGQPGGTELPIVDPRGLVTPHYDGWSLDFWVIRPDGEDLLLSDVEAVQQNYDAEGSPAVETRQTSGEEINLQNSVEVVQGSRTSQEPACRIDVRAESSRPAWLVVSLRPYNPEGVSTVDRVAVKSDRSGWNVRADRSNSEILFDPFPDRNNFSNFENGDVYNQLPETATDESGSCDLGMVSGAASFELQADKPRSIEVRVPLEGKPNQSASAPVQHNWNQLELTRCTLSVPNERFEFLFRSSLKTLHLLSGSVIYPGPFTYKRFWFRDAAFMLDALLATGYTNRVRRVLDYFPEEQMTNGYFCSQKGEWDSNGEALWIMGQYCEYTDTPPPEKWHRPLREAAEWIAGKRTNPSDDRPHSGLLPAGFSAEHFGPNDFYYWDDFWSVAGLRKAARMLDSIGDNQIAENFRDEATDLLEAINRSMIPKLRQGSTKAMPASPYREVDAGSIGSVVAGYPHDIYPPGDDRLLDTVTFLMEEHFHDGTFFQEMIHSGRNPYLSLHLAQVLMKASDDRFHDIVESVAAMASDTGKWPEAVHPATNGGCMGDGEHGWAAAEWVLMMRNTFVREDRDGLVVGQGIVPGWLDGEQTLEFGPTKTAYGDVAVEFTPGQDSVTVNLRADWHDEPPVVNVELPGYKTDTIQPDGPETTIRLSEE